MATPSIPKVVRDELADTCERCGRAPDVVAIARHTSSKQHPLGRTTYESLCAACGNQALTAPPPSPRVQLVEHDAALRRSERAMKAERAKRKAQAAAAQETMGADWGRR